MEEAKDHNNEVGIVTKTPDHKKSRTEVKPNKGSILSNVDR